MQEQNPAPPPISSYFSDNDLLRMSRGQVTGVNSLSKESPGKRIPANQINPYIKTIINLMSDWKLKRGQGSIRMPANLSRTPFLEGSPNDLWDQRLQNIMTLAPTIR